MHSSLLHVYLYLNLYLYLCLYTRHVVLPRSDGLEPTDAFYYLVVGRYSAFYYVCVV
jgi:hypothetical protein